MTPFHARILASDTSFFDGSCEFMTVPCTDGAMGILAHHSNMIAAVVPGELRFQPADEPLRTAAVSSGLVKIEDGEVLLLEYGRAQANLARAISRLRVKERWHGSN